MSKILIIIRREFLFRVKKKSFILLTLFMPFLFAALIFVPLSLSSIKDNSQQQVGVVDKTGLYTDIFQSNERFAFVLLADTTADLRADDNPLKAVVYISDTLSTHPDALRIYSSEEVSSELLMWVQNTINEKVRSDKLLSYHVDGLPEIIADVSNQVDVTTVKWSEDGTEHQSSTFVAVAAGMLLTLLIYLFVMTYGAMVMQSVLEEKTGRVVELMVSSVHPFQLMMGKMVGIALVGFLQMVIWAVLLSVMIYVGNILWGVAPTMGVHTPPGVDASAIAAATPAANSEVAEIMAALMGLPYCELGIMFVLYFVGGYLLYASFFAAAGASVSAQEDTAQFTMPLILLMLFALYAAMYSIENTNGPLAFWASLFPLTSPIVMMVRIPFGVPLWQEALSLVLLYGTAVLTVWIGAKIYRIGILMYGKKPSLRELARWIKEK